MHRRSAIGSGMKIRATFGMHFLALWRVGWFELPKRLPKRSQIVREWLLAIRAGVGVGLHNSVKPEAWPTPTVPAVPIPSQITHMPMNWHLFSFFIGLLLLPIEFGFLLCHRKIRNKNKQMPPRKLDELLWQSAWAGCRRKRPIWSASWLGALNERAASLFFATVSGQVQFLEITAATLYFQLIENTFPLKVTSANEVLTPFLGLKRKT